MFPVLDISPSPLPVSWRSSEVCGGLAEPPTPLVFGAAPIKPPDSEIRLHHTGRRSRVAQTEANARIQMTSPVFGCLIDVHDDLAQVWV